MKDCGDYSGVIRLYLDSELHGPRIVELRAHLERCPACRQVLEAEEELSCLLKRAQPLYSPPGSLRKRIQRIAGETYPGPCSDKPPNQGR
jgi:predicted anti-sigma-YlaC factor YlaD